MRSFCAFHSSLRLRAYFIQTVLIRFQILLRRELRCSYSVILGNHMQFMFFFLRFLMKIEFLLFQVGLLLFWKGDNFLFSCIGLFGCCHDYFLKIVTLILEILWSFRPIRRFRTCSAIIQFLSCYFINRRGHLGGQVFLIKIHQRAMSVWEKFTALSKLISSSYFKRNNRIAMVFWNADFRWGQCM